MQAEIGVFGDIVGIPATAIAEHVRPEMIAGAAERQRQVALGRVGGRIAVAVERHAGERQGDGGDALVDVRHDVGAARVADGPLDADGGGGGIGVIAGVARKAGDHLDAAAVLRRRDARNRSLDCLDRRRPHQRRRFDAFCRVVRRRAGLALDPSRLAA